MVEYLKDQLPCTARRSPPDRIRADDGLMTYYIAGEYQQTGDPSQGMIAGVNGTILVQQHAVKAVRGGASRKAVCGYVYEPTKLVDENLGDPKWMRAGLRCQACIDTTGTPA